MADKEFVNGLIVKGPRDGAPDFVKCAISIKRVDLGNWLRTKDEEWINLDVKVSKDGKWYAEVNNWKPENASRPSPPEAPVDPSEFDDDIPF